jgi:NAD(P)H-dependent flavin oxidoreductase YrpB (nitropropane dioxygenase family)
VHHRIVNRGRQRRCVTVVSFRTRTGRIRDSDARVAVVADPGSRTHVGAGAAEPEIIQGGMGVAVSGWRLARAVSTLGQLGVVSGTALDVVLARRLQLGDPTGDLRRAIRCFPDQAVAERVLESHFVPGGKGPGQPFASLPMFTAVPTRHRHELAVVGGFVEVFLAKEGHPGRVGINFLEKIQMPTPATLYGALLAGVDYVLVGAGIPREVPGLLDSLAQHQPVALPLHVTDGVAEERFELHFDPRDILAEVPPPLRRPRFLAIIASATLAVSLARRTAGVDGFVVEGPTAGGHNAPPRGPLTLADGQPVYGPRDEVDLAKIRALGLPFWLAGSYATPERLRQARRDGAAGIQVGTAFAFCEESGVDPPLRARVVEAARNGGVGVFTDPQASPTGFPFKVAQLEGTLSDAAEYGARERRCDLGYLRELYRRADGTLGYRCPAEPLEDYVRKGGRVEDTGGRKCVCNGLVATIGLGQCRGTGLEPALVTAGDDVSGLVRFMPDGSNSYSAADVIAYLLDRPTA